MIDAGEPKRANLVIMKALGTVGVVVYGMGAGSSYLV